MKDFGLSADERIKSRKDFERLFSAGKTLVSIDKKIRAIFLIENNSQLPGVKIAAVASHKAGNAVWRNRFKRLVKEAFRLNKKILIEQCIQKQKSLKIVFGPYGMNKKNFKKIGMFDISPGVTELMLKLKSLL